MIIMIKNRLLVIIDSVLNFIIISVVTIIGKDYLRDSLNKLDPPVSQKMSSIYITVNLLYLAFLMTVCIIFNYIQYMKSSHKLSNPRQSLLVNVLISIVPFTLPIFLTL